MPTTVLFMPTKEQLAYMTRFRNDIWKKLNILEKRLLLGRAGYPELGMRNRIPKATDWDFPLFNVMNQWRRENGLHIIAEDPGES